jgi:hypothetical protein
MRLKYDLIEKEVITFLGFKPSNKILKLLKDLRAIEIRYNAAGFEESMGYIRQAMSSAMGQVRRSKR